MKVLQIDVNYGNSSTGALVEAFHYYYLNKGIQSYVCYGRGKKVKEKNVYKFGLDIETVLHAFLSRLTGYNGYFSFFSTFRLIRKIKKINPDVIHIHELHAYFLDLKLFLKFLSKIKCKIVFTQHCEYLYTGKCGHSLECNKWTSCCKRCPHLSDYPKTWFFDRTTKMFLMKKRFLTSLENVIITTPSVWLSERVRKSFLRKFPLYTISNCVDVDIFHFKKTNLSFDKNYQKVVLSIASNLFSKEKGGEFILKLAELNPNILFVCIGNKQEIKNCPQNVLLLGEVNDKRILSEYYNIANLFLICSRKETFSLTCAESLCCGTKVVGFDSGAVVETAPEPYGYFCEYGNIDKLNQLLLKNLDLKYDKKTVSNENLSRFRLETIAESYISIYEKK